jgi:hypothetical protein
VALGGIIHLYNVYISNSLGPEEMNDTCRKMICTGTMDRGFTTLKIEKIIDSFGSII